MITNKYGHNIIYNYSKNNSNLIIVFVPHTLSNQSAFMNKFITNNTDTLFIFDNFANLKTNIFFKSYKTAIFLLHKNIIQIFKEYTRIINKYNGKIIYGTEYSFHIISKLSLLLNVKYYIEDPKLIRYTPKLLNELIHNNTTLLINSQTYKNDNFLKDVLNICQTNNISIINVDNDFNTNDYVTSLFKNNNTIIQSYNAHNLINITPCEYDSPDINNFKIYIINQLSRPDRKYTMEKQLSDFNITNYEFFNAYDKTEQNVLNDYEKYKTYSNYKNKIGVIGLIHSTINLFKYINESTDADYVIILEDDIFLHNNFKNLFKFDANNKDVDFVFLGYNLSNYRYSHTYINKFKSFGPTLLNINEYIDNNINFLGTYAYMCNKKYRNIRIQKGIEWVLTNNFHIDYGYTKLNAELNTKINYYIFGGEYLVVPYMLDEKSITYSKSTSQHWYRNKLVNVNNYYNSINNHTMPKDLSYSTSINTMKTITDFKIYIINQATRIDRKEHMISQLKSVNITNYEFFNALDNTNTKVTEHYNKIKNDSKYSRFKNLGVLGLIYSTVELFKHINKSANDFVIIIEDDIFFHKDILNLFNVNETLLTNSEFIYLGYNQYNKDTINKLYDYNERYVNINNYERDNNNCFYGTYGYMCNRNFRDLIIQKGVDYFIKNNATLDYGFNLIRLNNEARFFVFSGNQLLIPDILDEVCINNDRENCNMSWYENKKINTAEYINFNQETKKIVFIVPSYNNEKWIENNLTSIFNQKNYNNWHIIYINDDSTDKTEELFHNLTKNYTDKITYIKNKTKFGQAFNRYQAYNMCHDDDICIMLDGDDWLNGEFVLSYLNSFMKNNDIDLSYGDFNFFSGGKIQDGYKKKEYSQNVINEKKYRQDGWKATHLRVIMAKYLKQIHFYDIIDQYYEFIQVSTDRIESYAALELSNGRHKLNSQKFCIYNKDNSINYNTSDYNTQSNEYRNIINNVINNNTRYIKGVKKQNKLCIINIYNEDYKININKYKHELEDNYDLLVIDVNNIKLYETTIHSYNQYLILDDYVHQSLVNYNELNNKLSNSAIKNIPNETLITVIIPFYNSGKYIMDTLQSLINQTDKRFEVIFIDDCSSDTTLDIIQKASSTFRFNYKIVKNTTNVGYAYSLAKGIAHASTEYIITLDSDDVITSNTISVIYDNIKKHNKPGFMYSNFYYCDENLNIINKGFCKQVIHSNLTENCISQLRIINKKTYYKTPCFGYYENGNIYRKGAENKDIYFKLEEVTKPIYIDEYLYLYRKNIKSLTHTNNNCIDGFEIAKNNYIKRQKFKKSKAVFN